MLRVVKLHRGTVPRAVASGLKSQLAFEIRDRRRLLWLARLVLLTHSLPLAVL
jgi:hypothetical protein